MEHIYIAKTYPINAERVKEVLHCLKHNLPMRLYVNFTRISGDGKNCTIALDGNCCVMSYSDLLSEIQGLTLG